VSTIPFALADFKTGISELVRELVGQPAKTIVSLQSGREPAEKAGEDSSQFAVRKRAGGESRRRQ
jgi:hypothetical protein